MRFLAILILFLSFFTGCQKNSLSTPSSAQKAPNGRFLRLSFQSDPRSLDPRIGIDFPSSLAVKMLFEGLMRIGQDGKIEPALAESYEISDDHKIYTFHLRPCIWSNGDEITAYDFEYSWKKVVEPGGENLGAQNFYPIKNAKAIIQGKKSIDSVGIRALDEKTLQVELIHPTPYFLEVLASPSYFPVNSKVDRATPNWANQEGKAFVCNGPFFLAKHRVEDEIVVEKNPYYWDADSVKLPGISIAILDSLTQLNLFEKNQLDWLGKPLSKMPVDVGETLNVEYSQTIGIYWYFINVNSFPFQNKKIRQAFAYAINRKEITDHVLDGGETPAMALLPDLIATQISPFFKDHDTDKALKLFHEGLDELGITKEDVPEITINYTAVPIHQRVAETLQQQLKQTFHLNIKLEQQEWKVHYGKLQKGNYQIGGMAWQSWLRDPIYIMQTFRDRSDGVNMSKWENKRYQSLLNAAECEIDQNKRKMLFNKAESLILDEMPVIPLYFTTIAYCKNPKLKNVHLSELYEVDFRWAYLDN
jgi:oligopeptide transport system substrate-binding protein